MEGGRRKEEFDREGWRNGERESMREEGRETDGKKREIHRQEAIQRAKERQEFI